jgi:hypothetical protein
MWVQQWAAATAATGVIWVKSGNRQITIELETAFRKVNIYLGRLG